VVGVIARSRLRLGACALLTAIAVAGCGGSGSGATSKPGATLTGGVAARSRTSAAAKSNQAVALSFGAFVKKLLVANNDTETKAQLDTQIRDMKVVCGTPVAGQYPCEISSRTRPSVAAQGCVALVNRHGEVSGTCRAGPGPPPVTRLGYVDCSTVGRVVSINDPAGDTTRLQDGVPDGMAKAPWVDVTAMRVAATAERLCVDYETVAPPRPGSSLALFVHDPHALYPDQDIEPIIDYTGLREPEVEDEVLDPISGQVGVSGHWASLVVTAADIATTSAAVLRAPFAFRAIAQYEPHVVPGQIGSLVSDQAPANGRSIPYP
jgi:hypothetical protein